LRELNREHNDTTVDVEDEPSDDNLDLDDPLQDLDCALLRDDTESTADDEPVQQQLQAEIMT